MHLHFIKVAQNLGMWEHVPRHTGGTGGHIIQETNCLVHPWIIYQSLILLKWGCSQALKLFMHPCCTKTTTSENNLDVTKNMDACKGGWIRELYRWMGAFFLWMDEFLLYFHTDCISNSQTTDRDTEMKKGHLWHRMDTKIWQCQWYYLE